VETIENYENEVAVVVRAGTNRVHFELLPSDPSPTSFLIWLSSGSPASVSYSLFRWLGRKRVSIAMKIDPRFNIASLEAIYANKR
jgi:hypothetical protein